MREKRDLKIGWNTRWALSLIAGLSLFIVLGGARCLPSDCGAQLWVRGRILEQESFVGLSDAVLGGRSFTGGTETDYFPPFTWLGTANVPPPADDGTFEAWFGTFMPCDELTPFPRPDRVEIIVVLGECTQSFTIEINDETAVVVDEEDPYNVILELIDPILVPPCEE